MMLKSRCHASSPMGQLPFDQSVLPEAALGFI